MLPRRKHIALQQFTKLISVRDGLLWFNNFRFFSISLPCLVASPANQAPGARAVWGLAGKRHLYYITVLYIMASPMLRLTDY